MHVSKEHSWPGQAGLPELRASERHPSKRQSSCLRLGLLALIASPALVDASSLMLLRERAHGSNPPTGNLFTLTSPVFSPKLDRIAFKNEFLAWRLDRETKNWVMTLNGEASAFSYDDMGPIEPMTPSTARAIAIRALHYYLLELSSDGVTGSRDCAAGDFMPAAN